MATWDPDERGRYVGYLPQDVALFNASVRDNIARLTDASAEAVIAAARVAGILEMVLSLPQGFETRIGEGGVPLSGGQRQRIALARAVFGSPAIVVLDEPNSNLDAEGEAALVAAIAALKANGTTVVVIAHRPSVLVQMDKVLVLRNGTVDAFGPREQIMSRFARPAPVAQVRG